MRQRRSRALFVFSIVHHYREMAPVAEYYRDKGHEVHALIGYSGSRGDEAARGCESSGFVVHHVHDELKYGRHFEITDERGEVYRPAASDGGETGGWGATVRSAVHAFASTARKNYHITAFSRRLVDRVQPDVVFGGFFHSCGEFHNGIAEECSRREILYCCLPMSPYIGERVAVGYRFEHLTEAMFNQLDATRNLFRRLVAGAYPRWVRARNGKEIFMFDPQRMVSARIFGLIDRNPWQSPSERYDVVFVESDFSRNMLLESNYDPGKIVVSGKPLLDAVFRGLSDRAYSERLYEALRLKCHEPFILVNVEPSAEHAYSTWESQWERFRSLMRSLRETGRRVVLSLHPLCHPKNYVFVENEYGFTLSQKYKIAELYPYCNCVVSFPCSTNQLALVFKKPLIIYDWFGVTDGPRSDLFRVAGALYARGAEEVRLLVEETWARGQERGGAVAEVGARASACETIYEEVEKRLSLAARR